MSTKENSSNKFITFAKESCTTAKEDINEARKNGAQTAKDLVAPIKTFEVMDTMIENSASLMGQMVAGGVTLLMCPMKIVSKELALDK